jgi:hypothetical protein
VAIITTAIVRSFSILGDIASLVAKTAVIEFREGCERINSQEIVDVLIVLVSAVGAKSKCSCDNRQKGT